MMRDVEQDDREVVDGLQWSGSPKPLDESIVRWIEERCSHDLPVAYVYAVTHHYGQSPRRDWFEVTSRGLTFGCSLGLLLDPRPEVPDGIRDEWNGMGEYGSDRIVPMSLEAGGNLVCLDYTQSAQPRVVYFEHEMLDFVEIAPDIGSFFRMLRTNPHSAGGDPDESGRPGHRSAGPR